MQNTKTIRLTLLAMFMAIITVMTFVPYLGYITIPGFLSITTLHIAVIIGTISLDSIYSGLVLGTTWGITCLIYAMANGTADAAIFLDPRISVIPRILVGLLIALFYKLGKKACKNRIAEIILKIATILSVAVISGFMAYNIIEFAKNSIFSIPDSLNFIIPIIFAAIVLAVLVYIFFYKTKSEIVPILFATVTGTFSNTVLVLTAINLFAGSGIFEFGDTIKTIFNVTIALNGTLELLVASIIVVPCCVSLKKFNVFNRY